MTQYLGVVLAARSGLETQAQFRDDLAQTAAALDYSPGREWRSTEDTAIASSVMRGMNPAWANLERGQAYYNEGVLLWLDADTLIRKLTGNKKSLDDFEKVFLGKGGNTGPLIVTYGFEELVQDLNAVAPYDWTTFLHDRVDKITPHADFAGIEQGGYKLFYKEEINPTEKTINGIPGPMSGALDCRFSVGLRVAADGRIVDVLWNGPADKARLAPGEKILAVNGQIFSADALHAAIRGAKGTTEPIHLIVQAESSVSMIDIDYHDGERFPALERIDDGGKGVPDYLDDITKPLTKPEAAPSSPKTEAGSK
jgi:predicted metalloprotease with PDZ domain